MSDTYYPPVAFYFEVKVLGTPRSPWAATEIDASFQEVSGLDRELELQPLAEGGENRFTHQLPKRGKHPNLVLKRGLVAQKSSLAEWAEQTIGSDFSDPVEPEGQSTDPLVGSKDEAGARQEYGPVEAFQCS